MIRSRKNACLIILILFCFLMGFPNQIFSKTTRPSKSPKASTKSSTKVKTHPKTEPAQVTQTTSGGLQYDAQSAVLMDALTGQILYEQSPSLRISPASFVKVMTLYVVHDAIRSGRIKMDDMVTVSEKAWRMEGSRMFIKVGERVKVEDLMKGIAIASGNDACVALAEHVSGSEEVFVSKMNEKAKLLGLKDSQFKNSHGMPAEDQYSTAMDMAILSKRYVEDHPEALILHSTVEFEYNGIRQGNRNTLLQKNIGVDGLKTGHVEESGYHLAATAKRDGQRMIAVIMGCDRMRKRGPETQKLLEYGFKNFSTVEAVKKGATFGPVKVRRGKANQVTLSAAEEGRVTVSKGKESLVSAVPQLPEFITAPVQKDQVVAKILIQNEGKTVKEVNLLALSGVEKSLIPPWPILVGIGCGLGIIIILGLWWLRGPRQKKR